MTLRSLKRSLDFVPERGGIRVREGDQIGTVLAHGPEGIPAAVNFLLGKLGGDITIAIEHAGMMAVPVDEKGQPEPPSKLLKPAATPGVVGQIREEQPRVRYIPTFVVLAVAPPRGALDNGGKRLPEPDPRNSPESNGRRRDPEPNAH